MENSIDNSVSDVTIAEDAVFAEIEASIKFGNIDDLDSFIDNFAQQRDRDLEAANQFAVSGRKSLYTTLGAAWVACKVLMSEENKPLLDRALRRRQIHPATGDTLSFSPVIAMLFGRFDFAVSKVSFEGMKNLTKFVRDRSSEKYAFVMEWFDMNGISSDFADALEACEGKMDGAVKEVREARKPKPESIDVVAERLELLRDFGKGEPLTGISVPDKQAYGLLWYEVVDDEVIVRGHYPTKEDTVKKYAASVAKVQEQELRLTMMERDHADRLEEMDEDAALSIVKNNAALLERLFNERSAEQ